MRQSFKVPGLALLAITLVFSSVQSAHAQALSAVDKQKALRLAQEAVASKYNGADFFRSPQSASPQSLSRWVRNPDARLEHIEANSEQRQPYDVGATPYEMEIEGKLASQPALPAFAREAGEAMASTLLKGLGVSEAIFEAWPAYDDYGDVTWVFARWRESPRAPWQWFDANNLKTTTEALKRAKKPLPILPETYDVSDANAFSTVFDDFLNYDDLYQKPVYGDCVFTNASGTLVYGAWLPVDSREASASYLKRESDFTKNLRCRVLPQPARFNRAPVTFAISASDDGVKMPSEISWNETDYELPEVASSDQVLSPFPASFKDEYRENILQLDGEQNATFAHSNRSERFVRRNSADPDNQLMDVVDWLRVRYETMGFQLGGKFGEALAPGSLRTYREPFEWRGITESNFLAVIPGSLPASEKQAILLIDHIDTAFAQRVFANNKRRVAVPGADDNGSATSTLLLLAETLKDLHPLHDIVIAHITGEEYPADDLGTRELIADLYRNKIRVKAVVVNDMSGYTGKHGRRFQINAAASAESVKMAGLAQGVAKKVAKEELDPRTRVTVRLPGTQLNYGYNTDLEIFQEHGFDGILFNEDINRRFRINRDGYHEMNDNSKLMNFDYATAIAKVEIETVAELASRQ